MSQRRPAPPAPRSREAARAHRRRRLRSRLLRGTLLLIAVIVVVVGGATAFVFATTPLPPATVQAETTFLYDARGGLLAELHGEEDRVSVGIDQVAPVLVDAVLAAEDRDFFSHRGIDLSAIARAAWVDIRAGGAVQGGSTITQQYVKNAYVGDDRTLGRKVREAVVAVKLERRLDKAEILERYLNTIYLGRGAYGVQTAAEAYFGKDAADLDLREAAYLAGLIRAPETADAGRDPSSPLAASGATTADRRRASVLAAMVRAGTVTPEQADAAAAEPVAAYVRPRSGGDPVVGAAAGSEYFVDLVLSELLATRGAAQVYGGGLRVHTTLDPEAQRLARSAVDRVLDREGDPEGALVAIDEGGRVRAMIGGRDHDASQVNLAVGARGGGTGRQAGSAFKPFVLAEAVAQGVSLRSSFPSPATMVFEGADAGRDYEVANYGGDGHGTLDLVRATVVSSNTVYAQLIEEVGPAAVAERAAGMGITSPLPASLSLALGTGEVSPLELADAYLTLATRGTRVEPVVVERITDADGSVLEEAAPRRERALEPDVADQVTAALRQVVERGTGTGADPGFAVAGKTGTTQDHADAWFAGYTPRLAVAVWVGHPEGRVPMTNVHGRRVTGGSLPATIFRSFLAGLPPEEVRAPFPTPAGDGGRVLRIPGDDTTTTTAPTTTTTTTAAPAPTTSSSSSTSSSTSSTTAPAPTPTTAPTTSTTAPATTTTAPAAGADDP